LKIDASTGTFSVISSYFCVLLKLGV